MSYTSGDEENFSNSANLYSAKNLMRVGLVGAIGLATKIYWPETQKNQAYTDALAVEIETIKKQLPIKVDDVTALTDISAKGLEVTLNYKISGTLNPNMLANYRAMLKNAGSAEVCSNPNRVRLIEKGGSVIYKYEDTAGTKFDAIFNSCTAR
jgi:hypothetical protein